jgi:hypothetical protein
MCFNIIRLGLTYSNNLMSPIIFFLKKSPICTYNAPHADLSLISSLCSVCFFSIASANVFYFSPTTASIETGYLYNNQFRFYFFFWILPSHSWDLLRVICVFWFLLALFMSFFGVDYVLCGYLFFMLFVRSLICEDWLASCS